MAVGDVDFIPYPSKFSRPWFRPCKVVDTHPDLDGVVRTVTVGFRTGRGEATAGGQEYVAGKPETMLVPVLIVAVILSVKEQEARQVDDKVAEPKVWSQIPEPTAELARWQGGRARSQEEVSVVEDEQLVLREAALKVIVANEAAAAAERRLEEATEQRAPLRKSDRLRGLTAEAVVAYMGDGVSARLLSKGWKEDFFGVSGDSGDICG